MSKEKLHLVIIPYSAHGHLIPALMLSHKLVRLGFQVTYVCHHFRLEQIRKHASGRACSPDIKFATLTRNIPSDVRLHQSATGHDDVFKMSSWLLKHRPEDGEELKELILSGAVDSPDCLITDNMLASWAQDLADELNIPRVVFFPSPALALSFDFYVKSLQEQGKLPFKTGTDQEPLQIPGIDSVQLGCNEISGLALDVLPKDLFDFYVRYSLLIHQAAGALCNTFNCVEEEACKALKENRQLNPNLVPYLEVGPLLPDSYFDHEFQTSEQADSNHTEDYLNWLDQQPARSVVYISFGSYARLSREQVGELAHGLEASGKRYLWVLYDGGEDCLPEGFMERTSTRGKLVASWVSQLRILKHEAVGGFLTHCGWNSTLESVSQGVPMITMPFYGEQTGNAKIIVEQLGIGVRPVKGAGGLIRRDAFESAFVGVIDKGMNMREKAEALKHEARKAAERSPKQVEDFMRKVISEYNKTRYI